MYMGLKCWGRICDVFFKTLGKGAKALKRVVVVALNGFKAMTSKLSEVVKVTTSASMVELVKKRKRVCFFIVLKHFSFFIVLKHFGTSKWPPFFFGQFR